MSLSHSIYRMTSNTFYFDHVSCEIILFYGTKESPYRKARITDTPEAMQSPLTSCNIISGPLINLALEEK